MHEFALAIDWVGLALCPNLEPTRGKLIKTSFTCIGHFSVLLPSVFIMSRHNRSNPRDPFQGGRNTLTGYNRHIASSSGSSFAGQRSLNYLSNDRYQTPQAALNTWSSYGVGDQSREKSSGEDPGIIEDTTYDVLERATPAVPTVFHGRDELVAEGVTYMVNNKQAFLAILGAGGIGKTSIALHINNAMEVRAKYPKASYFLPCEVLPDAKLLLQGIIQRLDIRVGEGESHYKKLEEYLRVSIQPILLILDNFETPWNNDPVDIENLLSKLASSDQVSMIVTMRRLNGPGSLKWKKLGSESIPPLTFESAKKAFLDISETRELEQEKHDIETILKELDFVPLAITLIAKRAKTSPLKSLLKMWKEGKTKALKQGNIDGRLTSVNYSIGLSTKLLKSHEAELLAVICFLPDGVPGWVENLSEMLAGWEELDQSINTLLENSLVYSKNDTIQVLAPIREYVCGTHTDIMKAMTPLSTFYVTRLKQLSGTQEVKQNQIQPHIMNIVKILNEQAHHSPKEINIASLDILLGFTKFYPLLLELLNSVFNRTSELVEQDKMKLRFWRVEILRWLAMWQEAETEAKEMEKIMWNNPQSHARIRKQLGEIYRRQNRYTEAAEMLRHAKNQFEAIEDHVGAAQCLGILGETYLMQKKYIEAAEILTNAKNQSEAFGDQFGAAECVGNLGQILKMQNRYTEAAEMLSNAKNRFEAIGYQLGTAQCVGILGQIHQMQKRYTEAVEMLSYAKNQFEALGYQRGAAQCLRSLGQLYKLQNRYTEATEMLNNAKNRFETLGDQREAARCLKSLGQIYTMQNRYTEAE
ncbi:hypothetical protein D9758_008413 [Tetrapyrgos nigripes]|uniref:NB-ARC domain-containing protein n=1 Tax=Tetrapyrgos nigripes TaxID=182062 RepID=A0A8H5GDY3_9AGAR|nr:hypothetical protein D9758_008413 [Tetrapyrgos nigripes]